DLDSLYHHFSVGAAFAYGPENLISIIPPKVSIYYYMPEKNYEKYAAIEMSSNFIIANYSAYSILAGIKSKHLSFDTSLSFLHFPEMEYDYEMYPSQSYFALNPKLGLQVDFIWLKIGPSFIFGRHNFPSENDFGKVGNMRFNFELSANLPFKFPNYRKIAAYNNRPK
ncbi:MAG: hypothetical protein ACOYM7_05455, partial [Paludibacter sp.]